jgi:hypothetical protein
MGINSYPPSSGGEVSAYKSGNTAGRPTTVGSVYYDTTLNQLLILTNSGVWERYYEPIAAPTAVSAVDNGTNMTVTWTAPTNFNGTISGYKVTSSSGQTATVGSTTTATVNDSTTGTRTYTVQTLTAFGSSIPSNSVSGTFTAFTGTGGTITTSGSYTYHTFTSSGTFTPNKTGKSVDILVVSGSQGGGGGLGGDSSYGSTYVATNSAGIAAPDASSAGTGNRNGTTGPYSTILNPADYVGSSGGTGASPFSGSTTGASSGGTGAGGGGSVSVPNGGNATKYGCGGGGAASTNTGNWGQNGGRGGQVIQTTGFSIASTSAVTITVGAGTNGTSNGAGGTGGNSFGGVVVVKYLT